MEQHQSTKKFKNSNLKKMIFSFLKLKDQSKHSSTNKLVPLNFNLKIIIFSYLKLKDQRKIYWSNKELRKLLPDALKISISSFKKRSTYNNSGEIDIGKIDLTDGRTNLTDEEIDILKVHNQSINLDSPLLFNIQKSGQIDYPTIYPEDQTLCTEYSMLILKNKNLK